LCGTGEVSTGGILHSFAVTESSDHRFPQVLQAATWLVTVDFQPVNPGAGPCLEVAARASGSGLKQFGGVRSRIAGGTKAGRSMEPPQRLGQIRKRAL
jgi:hypothetical protein